MRLVNWKSSLGPQAVNHLNQFTSMTIVLQLETRCRDRRCDGFHHQGGGGSRAADVARQPAGRSVDLSRYRARSDVADGVGGICHVRDSGDSLRKLSPSVDRAVDSADGVGRRLGDAICLRRAGVALCFCRHVHAHGHRQKERHHDRRFRVATRRARRGRRRRRSTTPAWTASGRFS